MVHDGRQALAASKTSPPEVALLDIGMPDIDGYEVARRVRGDTRIRQLAADRRHGLGPGAATRRAPWPPGFDLHFTKPVEPQQLIELLGAELPTR